MSKKLRILMVTPALNMCGGIESYTMNYYRNMTDNIEIDFATHNITDKQYKNEIEAKGGKVFLLSPIGLKSLKIVLQEINNIFKENKYDIIHCNMANAAIFYFYYAKKYNVSVRIIHSHQSNFADKLSHKIRNIFLIGIAKRMATHNFACSKLAGDFLFRNKKYYIVNNAINVEMFSYNGQTRKKIRKEEKIADDELILANIGRFCNQKNQLFLIDIFKEVLKINNKAKLYLIGSGELKNKIERKVLENKLTYKVIVKDPINNVNEFLQAIDILVMPSLYEGLPVIGVEAQCAGVKCVFSNKITQEAKILQSTKYQNLRDPKKEWAQTIVEIANNKERKNMEEIIKSSGFDIKIEAKKLEKLYYELYKESIL